MYIQGLLHSSIMSPVNRGAVDHDSGMNEVLLVRVRPPLVVQSRLHQRYRYLVGQYNFWVSGSAQRPSLGQAQSRAQINPVHLNNVHGKHYTKCCKVDGENGNKKSIRCLDTQRVNDVEENHRNEQIRYKLEGVYVLTILRYLCLAPSL